MATESQSKRTTEIELEYYLGQAVALEGIPDRLLKRAGEAFALGQDDKAKWFRCMAQEFKEHAQVTREYYFSIGGTKGKGK